MTDKPKRKNDQPIPRRYWWFFGILAVMLFFYPIRILTYWWVNPILYLVLSIGLLIVSIGLARRYGWKRPAFLPLGVCLLLSVLHFQLSIREIGNCFVDDRRYSEMYVCGIYNDDLSDWEFLGWYQQIAASEIGMKNFCYYLAHKPLSCFLRELRFWSPILLIAGVIHYLIERKRNRLTS